LSTVAVISVAVDVESTLPNGIATVLFAKPPAVGEPAYVVGIVGLLVR